jgi:NAD-dependent DNA ligase
MRRLAMEYAQHGTSARGSRRACRSAQRDRCDPNALTLCTGTGAASRSRHSTSFPEDEQLKSATVATHQPSRRGVTADAFNMFNAPTAIAWGKVRRWQQRDDIFQVGQIAAMLVRGDITSPMRSKDVRGLPCSDQLKEVIHRCLGARGKRYEAAGELIAALRHRSKEVRQGRISSLEGKRISITGFLNRPRSEAIAAARKAGAIFQSKPGPSTDVLVRGRPNALQIAGTVGGLKIMEIRRLAAQGHLITVIGEKQFWKLVEPVSRSATSSRAAKGKAVARRSTQVRRKR